MFERFIRKPDKDGLIMARTRARALGRLAAITSAEPQHTFPTVIPFRMSRNKGPERTPEQKARLKAEAAEVRRAALDVNAKAAELEGHLSGKTVAGSVRDAMYDDFAIELNEAVAANDAPIVTQETKPATDGHGMRCAHCNSYDQQPVFAAGTVIFTGAELIKDIAFTSDTQAPRLHVGTVAEPQGDIKRVTLNATDLHFMDSHPDTDDALRATEALAGLYQFTQKGIAGL
jgi:hypothetical protein